MTEALKQWAFEKLDGEHEAEFWIRAFCEEVEKRASLKYPSGLYDAAIGRVMNELKRELLGS